MKEYKISVIIPVYNSAQYLSEAFNSLLRQTIGFNFLQVIFVDDCSADGSPEIINKYTSESPNVIAICLKENSGTASKPRNIGMEHAVADYFMFLDADDWFADNACEVLYKRIAQTNADMFSGYHSVVNENGTIILDKTPPYQGLDDIEYSLPDRLDDAFTLRSSWGNKIYKNRIIEENNIKFPPVIIGEDLVFLTQYLLSCNSFEYINQPIIRYRQRTKDNLSITKEHSLKYFLDITEYFKKMSALVKKRGQDGLFRILVSETFHVIILNLIDSQKLSDAEIIIVLRSYRWVFEHCKKQRIFEDLIYIVAISEAVLAKNYNHALHIILAIRLFRFESLQTLEGNAWLEEQVDNHRKALDNLKALLEQRESIIHSLQDLVDTQKQIIDRYHVSYWVKRVLRKLKIYKG